MKRFLTACACGLVTLAALSSNAQIRRMNLKLDDGTGKLATISVPALGGDITFTLPTSSGALLTSPEFLEQTNTGLNATFLTLRSTGASANGTGMTLNFSAKNSGGSDYAFGNITTTVTSNTAASEAADMTFQTAGVTRATFNASGLVFPMDNPPTVRTIGVAAQGTATKAGNALTMQAGTGNTTGVGGNLTLAGGTGGATSFFAGSATLKGGTAGTTGFGGDVFVSGGTPTDGSGGAITIAAADAAATGATNYSGGSVFITSGAKANAGSDGTVDINATNSRRVNIATGGANTNLVTIGGGAGTFSLQTTNIDISNTGALSNAVSLSGTNATGATVLSATNTGTNLGLDITSASISNTATEAGANKNKTGLGITLSGAYSSGTSVVSGISLSVAGGGATNNDITGTGSNWSVSNAGTGYFATVFAPAITNSAGMTVAPTTNGGGAGFSLDVAGGETSNAASLGGASSLKGGASTSSGNGGGVTIAGGAATLGTGGAVNIDGGTGSVAAGDVNIGVTNNSAINTGTGLTTIGGNITITGKTVYSTLHMGAAPIVSLANGVTNSFIVLDDDPANTAIALTLPNVAHSTEGQVLTIFNNDAANNATADSIGNDVLAFGGPARSFIYVTGAGWVLIN